MNNGVRRRHKQARRTSGASRENGCQKKYVMISIYVTIRTMRERFMNNGVCRRHEQARSTCKASEKWRQ